MYVCIIHTYIKYMQHVYLPLFKYTLRQESTTIHEPMFQAVPNFLQKFYKYTRINV